MAYDLEEQEKIDELKAWWGKYGNLVTAVIFLVALSVLGVNGYNAWRNKQSGEASLAFDQMTKAKTAKNQQLVKETAAVLMDKYSRTSYAQMAALEVARVNVDAGDLKTAESQLQWAVEHAQDSQYRLVARLRLSSVQMDLGESDAALKTVSGEVPEQFASSFADRRGDIYLATNKLAEAKAQYQEAVDHLPAVGKDLQVAYGTVEKLKLDALSGATGSMASAPAAVPVTAPAQAAAPTNPPAVTPVVSAAAPAAASSVEK